ncbi:MAG: TonB-dependent receptor, partial [Bacteroidia bacterium]|nr:TonB-dependent receptor [Bacteroidia bacterium]
MKLFAVKIVFSLLLLLIIVITAGAQNGISIADGTISGRVIDTATGIPIEFASVGISKGDSNLQVNAVTTDEKGNFTLTDIKPGVYTLTVFFEGYKKYTLRKIVVKPTKLNIELGNIKLAASSASLQTVTVTAEKEAIESKPDEIVFNVSKDLTAQTGVATDVLKKIPEVSVDIDGNVELQGNSNIRFLIDGKPSTIFGTNINEVLQTIPASQIEKIEVITNPGAKYDVEGTGGIINIILKRSKIKGVNGSVSLTAGTRMENGGANINIRSGNFGVYGYFGGNATLSSNTPSTLTRAGTDTGSTMLHLSQNGNGTLSRQGYWTGTGFDWEANRYNNIYGGINYNQSLGNTTATSDQQSILNGASGNTLSDINTLLNSSTQYNQSSEGGYLNYKRTFDRKEQELDVDFNSSHTSSTQYYSQSQQNLPSGNVFEGSNGSNPGTNGGTNLSVDYRQPVDSNINFETGAKATFNRIQSISDVSLLNPQS